MKTLYLVRHAKSSWKDASLSDSERPLNKRGEKDAPEMGRRLALRKIKPDLLLSSPAKRAYATAKKIAIEMEYPDKDIKTNEALYHAGPQRLLNIIREQDDKFESIMLFGHNPGLTDFANLFSKEYIDNIPTTGVFAINIQTDKWKAVKDAAVEFLFYDYPKKTAENKFLS